MPARRAIHIRNMHPGPWPDRGPFDEMCLIAVASSYNMLVPWFLMASFAYYHRDITLISDELFKQICDELWKRWASIEHPHLKLINRTWGQIMQHAHVMTEDEYPSVVIGAAYSIVTNEPHEYVEPLPEGHHPHHDGFFV
jgi:hypothetical protein